MDTRLALVDAAAGAARPVIEPARVRPCAGPARVLPPAPVTLALVVPVGRAMRLSRPRGSRIAVSAGRVWITQSGRTDDCFLCVGDAIDILEAGVLVLESDGAEPALVQLGRSAAAPRPAPAGVLRRWLDALWVTRRELHRWQALSGLDDRMLRDIGIPAELRHAIAVERDRAHRAEVLLERSRSSW
jgi:hypothetical protein